MVLEKITMRNVRDYYEWLRWILDLFVDTRSYREPLTFTFLGNVSDIFRIQIRLYIYHVPKNAHGIKTRFNRSN